MSKPAQQILVERFIKWDRIRERLDRYPAIRTAFPLELLRRHESTPPYFCHYMAWRLGTWVPEAEHLVARFEEVLAHGAGLPGWKGEAHLLEDTEYAVFWSLNWQLQLAEYLSSIGTEVCWGNPGPDLSVVIEGTRVSVEALVFRKSFGLDLFISDILDEVGHDIKTDHDYCLPYALPKKTEFLDGFLGPFVDPENVVAFRRQAAERYPVVASRHESSLVAYFDGDDTDNFDPTLVPSVTGDTNKHLDVILNEAIRQKAEANSLVSHRPNLVAANYLLSADSHLAFNNSTIRPTIAVAESIDGFAVSHVGIDERLERRHLFLVESRLPRGSVLESIATSLPATNTQS